MQAGADIHAKDGWALCWAAQNGHTERARVLLQAGANSACLEFSELEEFLTPQFILSLSENVITAMETSHAEIKERYKYSENKSHLENTFDAKISFADLYYRLGGPGYYQAISLD